jgi:sortase B
VKVRKGDDMKKSLKIIIVIGCLTVFLFAAHGLVNIAVDYYQNSKETDEVQEKFYDTVSAEEKEDNHDSDTVRPEFQDLLKENDDLVGWVKIEDTKIDYPILQTDNNEDYLTQNFNKEYSILGSIFMDFRNDMKTLGKNTIIYGHRTKNGSMFEHLIKFKDKAFLEEHRTFPFETLYDSYEAEVFAVYMTTTDFNYIQTDFASDEEFESYLSTVQEESIFETDVEVSGEDIILTLSTCDEELDSMDGRLVVQAKLVKKE